MSRRRPAATDKANNIACKKRQVLLAETTCLTENHTKQFSREGFTTMYIESVGEGEGVRECMGSVCAEIDCECACVVIRLTIGACVCAG